MVFSRNVITNKWFHFNWYRCLFFFKRFILLFAWKWMRNVWMKFQQNVPTKLTPKKLCVYSFCRSLHSNMVKILLYIQKATETLLNVALQSDIGTNRTTARNIDTHNMHASRIRFWEAILLWFNIWTETRTHIHISSVERRRSKGLAECHGWQRTGMIDDSHFLSII